MGVLGFTLCTQLEASFIKNNPSVSGRERKRKPVPWWKLQPPGG
jgi:hypothetical protein